MESLLAAVDLVWPDKEVNEQLEIDLKYEGYITRQEEEIERTRAQYQVELPVEFNYADVKGLSNEVRQKLQLVQPETIGQASRISGVTPAAVSLLLIHLKKTKQLSSRKLGESSTVKESSTKQESSTHQKSSIHSE